MRIAELRERLVLQEPVRTADGGGGTVVTWADVVEVWAEVKPRTGNETFAADRVSGRVSHEIVIRHREGVCPEMRFTRGARVFELRAVFDEASDGRFLTCLAEERDL